jgi:hypothetical protein
MTTLARQPSPPAEGGAQSGAVADVHGGYAATDTGTFKTLDPAAYAPVRDTSDSVTVTVEVDFVAARKEEDQTKSTIEMLADLTAALDSVIPPAWPERTSPESASRTVENTDSSVKLPADDATAQFSDSGAASARQEAAENTPEAATAEATIPEAATPEAPATELPPIESPAAETAPTPATPPQPERRALAARLDAREYALLAALLRLYREYFRAPLDAARFVVDDAYGRAVIEATHVAGHPALIALAARYMDEEGRPRRHRRGTGSTPPEETRMDNRRRTLACDGTLQTMGEFHGIATDCVVRNEEFSEPVVVSAKGFLPAALAPGHAIALRTSVVRVEGPAGSVVTLDFVGYPDLAAGS